MGKQNMNKILSMEMKMENRFGITLKDKFSQQNFGKMEKNFNMEYQTE